MKKLYVLTGPTAVGKSSLSIELAKAIDAEIISGDSMQVYKQMDIGTAKISKEEMGNIPHHLIDFLEPSEDFNTFIFKELANKAILDIYNRNKIPLIVGGTGFYIQSVVYDIDFESVDDSLRKSIIKEKEQYGMEYIYDKLKKIDPNYAQKSIGNEKRIIRALEFYYTNGYPLSMHNEKLREKSSPYDLRYFVLTKSREKLYEDINKRVDMMIDSGLVEEAKSVFGDKKNRNTTASKAIGYRELIEYFDGEVTIENAIEKIKQNTRHFAKRQLTWFRREKDVIWVDKDHFKNESEILEFLLEKINE